jgi:opacity protein-like surface antigen
VKRILPLAAATAALFLLGTAQAQQRTTTPQSPLYGELGYSFLDLRDSSLGLHANPQALRGIIGYSFHPNFAVEGMAAFGTSSDSDRGIDVKVRNMYGIFLKPKMQWNNVEAFARVGWAHERIRASALGLSASGSDSDFAYGVGANYNFSPRMYAGVDWMRYFDKNSTRIDGVTVNVGWRF